MRSRVAVLRPKLTCVLQCLGAPTARLAFPALGIHVKRPLFDEQADTFFS